MFVLEFPSKVPNQRACELLNLNFSDNSNLKTFKIILNSITSSDFKYGDNTSHINHHRKRKCVISVNHVVTSCVQQTTSYYYKTLGYWKF